MNFYDNSMLADYKRCPRYYYLRHVRHWEKVGVSRALAFGSGWHAAMNVVWSELNSGWSGDTLGLVDKAIQEWRREIEEAGLLPGSPESLGTLGGLSEDSKRTEGVAREMLYHYIQMRAGFIQSGELMAVEQPFAVPLGETSQLFYIGRWDKVFRMDGGVYIIEHKTTSSYKKDGGFMSKWLNSFSPNGQVDGYLYSSALTYGREAKGVLVDGALVHKSVHDKFTFIPVSKQFSMLDTWLYETEEWVERISRDIRRLVEGRPGAFPKNTESCANYTGCVYRDICRFVKDPTEVDETPTGFVEHKWEPFDVLKIEQLGLGEKKGDKDGK